MQHNQVIEENLVEQYLLDEMSAPQRDAFEEHFFDCRECAADVRATSAFMEVAREELRHAPAAAADTAPQRRFKPAKESPWKRWWGSLWNPGFAFAMAALCLSVTGYQNLVTYPRLAGEVAQFETPQVLPTLSLVGSASRGGGAPTVAVPGAQLLAITFDIPGRPEFSSYTCRFFSASHTLLSTVQVSAEQAKDTVTVRVPAGAWGPGQYAVEVQGNTASGNAEANVALTRYSFVLNGGPSTSSH